MADCHDLFIKFHSNIKLSDSNNDNLRKARDTIRDRIVSFFKEELEEKVPKFQSQGSFSMYTVVTPLDGEFDLDDGVYLQNIDLDSSEYPSPEKVHRWIYKAVEGHTKAAPIDKSTCIRVTYAGEYHVDLPIYGNKDSDTYLAEKGEKGWHKSDPVTFTEWFTSNIKLSGEQLRKVTQYIKAWADYKGSTRKLLNSFALTILGVNNFEKAERDDVAFSATIRNIVDASNISSFLINPVDTSEIISEKISQTAWTNFKQRLSELQEIASEALKNESKEEASKLWQKVFGDRFPDYIDPKKGEKPLKTSSPAILGDNGRFAE